MIQTARFRTLKSAAQLTIISITAVALNIPYAHAYSEDKDWPCIQAKVKKLSAGQMWPGMKTAPDDISWKDDKKVVAMVETLLPRRVSLKETESIIDEFASKYDGENKDIALEKIYLGLLSEINSIRADIISGIRRFSHRQKDLVKRITDTRHKVSAYEKKDTDGTLTTEEDREFAKLEQALEWDQRIHEEREQSLEFVCEAPVLLDQRLFAIARQLKKHIQE